MIPVRCIVHGHDKGEWGYCRRCGEDCRDPIEAAIERAWREFLQDALK